MIDLHIHSNFSDGTDSTDDIINIAKRKNISAISLTDHDTTYGVDEIVNKGKEENIIVVPGVEISSVSNGHLIHILGYNIDINNTQLQDILSINGKFFDESFLKHYSWLIKNKVLDFDINKVIDYSRYKQCMSLSDILKAMILYGEPYTLKEWPTFVKKLMQYPSDFIEKFPVHPSEVVEVILLAGGIPTFAHPARIMDADIKEMELLIPKGLKGIEVYYPFHSKEKIKEYENFALKHDLIKTGGTDWHGEELTNWNVEIGDCGVNELPFK